MNDSHIPPKETTEIDFFDLLRKKSLLINGNHVLNDDRRVWEKNGKRNTEKPIMNIKNNLEVYDNNSLSIPLKHATRGLEALRRMKIAEKDEPPLTEDIKEKNSIKKHSFGQHNTSENRSMCSGRILRSLNVDDKYNLKNTCLTSITHAQNTGFQQRSSETPCRLKEKSLVSRDITILTDTMTTTDVSLETNSEYDETTAIWCGMSDHRNSQLKSEKLHKKSRDSSSNAAFLLEQDTNDNRTKQKIAFGLPTTLKEPDVSTHVKEHIFSNLPPHSIKDFSPVLNETSSLKISLLPYYVDNTQKKNGVKSHPSSLITTIAHYPQSNEPSINTIKKSELLFSNSIITEPYENVSVVSSMESNKSYENREPIHDKIKQKNFIESSLPCQLSTLLVALFLRSIDTRYKLNQTHNLEKVLQKFLCQMLRLRHQEFQQKLIDEKQNKNIILASYNEDIKKKEYTITCIEEKVNKLKEELKQQEEQWIKKCSLLEINYKLEYDNQQRKFQEIVTEKERMHKSEIDNAVQERIQLVTRLQNAEERMSEETKRFSLLKTNNLNLSSQYEKQRKEFQKEKDLNTRNYEIIQLQQEDLRSTALTLHYKIDQNMAEINQKNVTIDILRLALQTSLRSEADAKLRLETLEKQKEELKDVIESKAVECHSNEMTTILEQQKHMINNLQSQMNKLKQEALQRVIEQEVKLKTYIDAKERLEGEMLHLKKAHDALHDASISLRSELDARAKETISSRLKLESEIARLKHFLRQAHPKINGIETEEIKILETLDSNLCNLNNIKPSVLTKDLTVSIVYDSCSSSSLDCISDNSLETFNNISTNNNNNVSSSFYRLEQNISLEPNKNSVDVTLNYDADNLLKTTESRKPILCLPSTPRFGDFRHPSNDIHNNKDIQNDGVKDELLLNKKQDSLSSIVVPSSPSVVELSNNCDSKFYYGGYEKSTPIDEKPILPNDRNTITVDNHCNISNTLLKPIDVLFQNGIKAYPDDHILKLQEKYNIITPTTLPLTETCSLPSSENHQYQKNIVKPPFSETKSNEEINNNNNKEPKPTKELLNYHHHEDEHESTNPSLDNKLNLEQHSNMSYCDNINYLSKSLLTYLHDINEDIERVQEELSCYSSQCRLAYIDMVSQTARFDAVVIRLQESQSTTLLKKDKNLNNEFIEQLKKELSACRWILDVAHTSRDKAAAQRLKLIYKIDHLRKLQQDMLKKHHSNPNITPFESS